MYKPRVLLGQDIATLRAELQQELNLISELVGQFESLNLAPRGEDLRKPREGELAYFIAGVAVEGISSTTEGLHLFRDGAWRKLEEI